MPALEDHTGTRAVDGSRAEGGGVGPGAIVAGPAPLPSETLPIRVLVAEDAGAGSDGAAAALTRAGAAVARTHDLSAALGALHATKPDAVVAEVRWSGGSGFSILEAAQRLRPDVPVLLWAAHPTVPDAVRAIQAGAESYVGKPLGVELIRSLRAALERRAGLGRDGLSPRPPRVPPRQELVGGSPPMAALLSQIELVGPTRTTVLLLGETGTGKERLAQALHDASPRRDGPFVAVNCAALTETVLESELFGHEKGAFSGAHARREGRFKIADKGTIFLDEIGEISPAIQVKLLRVLQERKFERVGGNETLSVDVRIVAATNRHLAEMVAAKTFRADLYYRLNVVALEVPPLRARKEDMPALVRHILPRLALELGISEPRLTPEAMRILCAHDWPGNVRELENVLERAVVMSRGQTIGERALPPELFRTSVPEPGGGGPQVPGATFAEIERHAIMTTYEACGRSPQRTAAVLGLSPRTIHYRLREYRGETGRRLRPWPPSEMSVGNRHPVVAIRPALASVPPDAGDETDCTPCATSLHRVR